MKNYKSKRILVILSEWPSTHHPYLTFLIAALNDYYSSIEFFAFRGGDIKNGSKLVGKDRTHKVLSKLTLRWQYTRNPIKYFKPIGKILLKWKAAYRVYIYLTENGYNFRRAFGQILFNHGLIGQKYDLVYFNALQSTKHICLKAFFPNTTLIASSRGQDFDFEPDIYKNILPQINYLHTLGTYLANKAVDLGYDQSKISLIPPAFLPYRDSKSPESPLSKRNEFIITTAARLEWTKGFTYMLRTLATISIKNPGLSITYNIVGAGRENEFLRVEADRLGLQGSVHFHGWCSQDKVNEIVSKSDLYILLSIEEGFNNSVLQAQYLGVPCIVSNTGGLPENVLNGITGYVVNRYETIHTAELITKLINDRPLLIKLGKQAKKRVVENFSLDEQINNYIEFFNNALEN